MLPAETNRQPLISKAHLNETTSGRFLKSVSYCLG
jgi:hypothetical protein